MYEEKATHCGSSSSTTEPDSEVGDCQVEITVPIRAEEKARQEARPEAGRLKEEKQRELRLRQLEEQRRLKEEAER
ncbi:hypothetical protein DPMN_004689 [Dreissena polymorpha]|uniref:Uncharacterized protein n=1 Tax=Dreissena polymorpha TaxID=45954 RepID=A0A9D4RVW3_DREPO|nr:hypothetical protein DPMN_004689 [Dreissena polymorpha]